MIIKIKVLLVFQKDNMITGNILKVLQIDTQNFNQNQAFSNKTKTNNFIIIQIKLQKELNFDFMKI